VKAITIIGAVAATILFFFAIVFAFTASIQATTTRLCNKRVTFHIAALAIIIVSYNIALKPKTV